MHSSALIDADRAFSHWLMAGVMVIAAHVTIGFAGIVTGITA